MPEAAADPIMWQPAVRAMLLTQKAVGGGGRSNPPSPAPAPALSPYPDQVAEGGRSMVFECAKIADRMQACE